MEKNLREIYFCVLWTVILDLGSLVLDRAIFVFIENVDCRVVQ